VVKSDIFSQLSSISTVACWISVYMSPAASPAQFRGGKQTEEVTTMHRVIPATCG